MQTTPLLDITLQEAYNLYYLGISDMSFYPNAWTISNATLEVTPPGFNKIALDFTPKSANFYKSYHLGITCGVDNDCIPVPDGVYKVKYSISPNISTFVEKQFMRVANIRCQFGEAFLKANLADNCNKQERDADNKTLQLINILIEGSVAAVNDCDISKANKYYNKAKQMLDNFLKHGCGCK